MISNSILFKWYRTASLFDRATWRSRFTSLSFLVNRLYSTFSCRNLSIFFSRDLLAAIWKAEQQFYYASKSIMNQQKPKLQCPIQLFLSEKCFNIGGTNDKTDSNRGSYLGQNRRDRILKLWPSGFLPSHRRDRSTVRWNFDFLCTNLDTPLVKVSLALFCAIAEAVSYSPLVFKIQSEKISKRHQLSMTFPCVFRFLTKKTSTFDGFS